VLRLADHKLARVTAAPPSFVSRLWLCWVCLFRVLFDAAFAGRVLALGEAPSSASPEPDVPEPPKAKQREASAPPVPAVDKAASAVDGALQLLGLFQREGRLLDFLQQDVTAFGDADVGAAARVVHAGCRRALEAHAQIKSLRSEAEGSQVEVTAADARDIKLVGNVSGSAPYRGVLRHRGWRVESLRLPSRVGDQDASVVASAEVEL